MTARENSKTVMMHFWHMECCGEPFKVGDHIERWPVDTYKYAGQHELFDTRDVDFLYMDHYTEKEMEKFSWLEGDVAVIRLVYFRYTEVKPRVLEPVEAKIIEATEATKWHADIGDFRFGAFVVKIDNAKIEPIKIGKKKKFRIK